MKLTILLLAAVSGFAQEYRATLLGSVSDPTGAAVAGAAVTATHLETRVATATRTQNDGGYLIPFLPPGKYTLRVEQSGFKTLERGPIELRVNDRARVDVALEIGQISDRVTVVAEAPLLEVSSSNRGQVVENRKITDLPLNSRNPFTLMNLAAGVQYTGSMLYFRPFDNGAIADFSINGGRSGVNEFQIDGVSDNANTGRSNLAYVPPVEATQEFKIQTNTYDAQYGRTGGGVISLSIKPGANDLHGAVYEYLRRTPLEANQFANNASRQPRAKRLIDQYGFEVDGPLAIPRLYRGKDRTFFMFALEKYRESTPQPALGSVPTAEQRRGDFSTTLAASGRPYIIYDPLTIQPNPAFDPRRPVTLANLQYLRSPFAGNQAPSNRFEPIATRVLADIPLPNQTGDPVTHVNNWFGANVAEDTDFKNLIARLDHVVSPAWRIYGRWNHNYRDGGRINYWGWETPARRQIHAGRRNDGAVFDAVGTLNPHTILTARLGYNRFKPLSIFTPRDVSSLGFPRSFTSQLQMPDKYPMFTFENYLQTSINEWDIQPSETYTAQAGLTRVAGSHSLKFGVEYRLMHYASLNRGNASGTFDFTRSWTRSNPQVADPEGGNAIASLLLGYMNAASATLNATPYLTWRYPVLYFQDDWQVNRRLTLNFGLRWDYESPPVERYNAQNRGFDFTARSPYQVPGLDLRGGLLFAGVGGQPRGAFDSDFNNWQPRFGLAYKLLGAKPLVFRAGFGRYFLPTTEFGGTTGFAQTTSAQTSTPDFLPFQVLSNPFPNGLIRPPAAGNGLKTQAGDSVSFNDPRRSIPNVWQYSAGFQYELLPGLLVEAGYAGSQTKEIQVGKGQSYLTTDQLALGTPYLNTTVPNPFFGVLPASTSRGAQPTIQRRNLITQYPHFTGVTMNNQSLGESWYHSLQLKLEQRFKHGLSYLVSYTASKTMETTQFRNSQDSELSRELVSFDVPRRLVVSGIYEFPIGPGKRWARSGLASRLAGGWQIDWTGVIQSGTPMSYPDYYVYGNPKLSSGQSLNRWFDTSPSIWVQRPPDTLRTTPFRSPNIRRYARPQYDATLIRDFRLTERHKLQFKVSAFNLTNTPIFGFPNTTPTSPLFGVVPITQINLPRSVELGFRFVF